MCKRKPKVRHCAYCIDCFLDIYKKEGIKYNQLEVLDNHKEECDNCGNIRRLVVGLRPTIFEKFFDNLELFAHNHFIISIPILILLSPILIPRALYLTRGLRKKDRERKRKLKNKD